MSRGEVVLRSETDGRESSGRLEAAVLIRADVERIWDTVTACDDAVKFVPGLRSCRVLERKGDKSRIEHRVKFSWFLPEVTYVLEAEYDPPRRIDFQRVVGDLKELNGTWTLEPLDQDGRTLVAYSVDLDPGFFVPGWLVRLALSADLPDLLKSLRRRVEQSALP